MARRGGKAANRRARQQRRNRPAGPVSPAPVSATESITAAPAAEPAITASSAPAPRPPSVIPALGSALSAHAREEYHYVGRDLRNIGILVVIMFAVLAAATLAINVL